MAKRVYNEEQRVRRNEMRVIKRHDNNIENKPLVAKQKLARKEARDNLWVTNPEQFARQRVMRKANYHKRKIERNMQ